jgi:hypothetical protein
MNHNNLAAWVVGLCVALQFFGACGGCWLTYNDGFCRDPSCFRDGGDAE